MTWAADPACRALIHETLIEDGLAIIVRTAGWLVALPVKVSVLAFPGEQRMVVDETTKEICGELHGEAGSLGRVYCSIGHERGPASARPLRK